MTQKEFAQMISKELTKILGHKFVVKIKTVRKNNNINLYGICILKNGEMTAPLIDLQSSYEKYVKGMDMRSILQEIIQNYFYNTKSINPVHIMNFVNPDFIKKQVVLRVINHDKNKKLLKEIPHIDYLDLAIIFMVLIKSEYGSNTVITVKKDFLKMWDMSTYTIFRYAIKNSQMLLPYQISSLSNGITMLTNKNKVNGAACMLYQNVLSDYAEMINHDLIVVPSNVHEVCLLPYYHGVTVRRLKEFVDQTIYPHIDTEEFLSNKLYFFNRNTNAMKILTKTR